MKNPRVISIGFLACVILLVTATALASAEISQQEWDAQQARNRWLDHEKQLLQEREEIRKDIDELRAQVDERVRKIAAAQVRLDRIRHDLITIKMKLLP
ncbi:MAG: hypothetical protein K2X93_01875 [Candidatus Obscuribacterales bacterium]|nr:hypothetical protein [Candidatus Obscuribacterales bacterium]